MAWQATQPYHQQLEHRNFPQPYYHSDNICGSSFHGLATSVEQQLQRRDINTALSQVKSCIDARLNEMRKRQFPDTAHNYAIEILNRFYQKLQNINHNFYTFANYLHLALVRYNDANHEFIININNQLIGGKNKTKRKQSKRRKKSKRTKRTNLRFRYIKNKTLKKKKLV
jgi:hypothetical protein